MSAPSSSPPTRVKREVTLQERGRRGRYLLGDNQRQASLLDRKLSTRLRAVVWLAATGVFILSLAWWFHGTHVADVQESTVPMAAVEKGLPQCAYPAKVWSAVPPLYPVIGAGVIAVTGVGKSDVDMLHFVGADCRLWANDHGYLPLFPLIAIGFLGWPVLVGGVLAVLAAAGRSRTRWEALALLLLALTPPVASAIVRYLHPEDLFAMGCVLIAVAAALRSRWLAAGICIGVACCFKQFALLPAVPLLIVAPRSGRARYVGGLLAAATVIVVPLAVSMGRGMIDVMWGVDATPSFEGTALVGRLGLHGVLLTFVSRVLPLIGAGAAALWARSRLGRQVLTPAPVVALIGFSLVLRLVFEVSVFSYYFLATAVMLILLDVVFGRLRLETLCWIVACGAIYPPLFDPLVLVQSSHPIPAQLVLVLPAVVLVGLPLYRICTRGSMVERAELGASRSPRPATVPTVGAPAAGMPAPVGVGLLSDPRTEGSPAGSGEFTASPV